MYRQCAFRVFKIARSPQLSVVTSASHDSILQCRTLHLHSTLQKTIPAVQVYEKPGFVKQFIKKMGWLDHSKAKLKASGYILYENVADKIQYFKFFQEFGMADTFYSWFLVTELHIWMLMVRTMAEGDEGRFTRNSMVEAMWQDVSTRAKQLEMSNPSAVREQLHEISEQFQAALIAYDEGILSDDKVLAGALWRRFFQKDCDDPELVERLVHYVRKQVKLLDGLSRDETLISPDIQWIDIPKKFGS